MTSTEIPQIFLDISKQDLYSSKLLFENECYPQSVLLFQQSIEKAVKSIAIWMGLTTIKKARNKIGHQGMNLFGMTNSNWQNSINRMKNNEVSTEVISQVMGFGSAKDALVEVEEKSDEVENLVKTYLQRNDHIEISQEDVTRLLNEMYKLKNDYRIELEARTNFFETDGEWIEFIKETASMLSLIIEHYSDEFAEQDIPVPENITEQVENELKRVLKVTDKESWNTLVSIIVDLNFIFGNLFNLCIFADPHSISARYPEEDFNPMSFYTLELPFISKLPEITDITENILVLLDSAYAKYQEVEAKRLALEMGTQKDD